MNTGATNASLWVVRANRECKLSRLSMSSALALAEGIAWLPKTDDANTIQRRINQQPGVTLHCFTQSLEPVDEPRDLL
jgi:hypothetical protein